jgi:glycosyltransferase involved in cell wall biosynthesis
MKIFYCETSNDGTIGGSHTCMYNLVRHFDRSRFRFTVGSFSENPYFQRYRDLGVDVAVLPIVPPRKEGLFLARKAINWYRREYRLEKFLLPYLSGNRFDLVLMNNTILESTNFVHAAKRSGLPIVVYERGILEYRPKHIAASAQVDASIAVSGAILRNVREYKFESKIVDLIYDGIDPASFEGPFDRAAVKRELKIPVDAKVIGIVGNVRSWKGQKYFIEAFRHMAGRYPDLHGLIVGGWSEVDRDYLDSLRRAVKEAGLEERILFLGYRKDTPPLLSILDVFIHASILPEPFGMVLLEAMAAGVPIVATRFGGPVEILDAGECGALVPPEDGKAIAEACIRYFEDCDHRKVKVEKARARLRDHFHIDATVRKVGALLDTIRRTPADRRFGWKSP